MRPGYILRDAEIGLIKQVLESMGGNKTHAAIALGISLRCLRLKIQDNDELKEFRYRKGSNQNVRRKEEPPQTRYGVGTLEK